MHKEKKYYVGIDFGHGETSVSRVPGYNNAEVSQIALRKTGYTENKKIISAICRKENGEWILYHSKNDFRNPDLYQGFKGQISSLNPTQKKAFCEFAKLVFKSILANDPDLIYDEQTGDSNFIICIASPSDWRRENPNILNEYLEFFKYDCCIKPIEICINESDAAFFTKYDKRRIYDSVFVIDLGSSTIDFTTYNQSDCVPECCWGNNLVGAHKIEDYIVEYGFENEQNIINMEMVAAERLRLGLDNKSTTVSLSAVGNGCNVQNQYALENVLAAISLAAREAKENYYTNKENDLEVRLCINDFFPNSSNKRKEVFYINMNNDEFDKLIAPYKEELQMVLKNAAERLHNYNITPSLVLLSGGANRMNFVEVCVREAFPKSEIYPDQCPEWVVSDGAAKYAKEYWQVKIKEQELIEEFTEWAKANFKTAVESAALKAFKDTLREQMKERLYANYVKGGNSTTLDYLYYSVLNPLLRVVTSTDEFQQKAQLKFHETINSVISKNLKNIITEHYRKEVAEFPPFVETKDLFKIRGGFSISCKDYVEKEANKLFRYFIEDVKWDKSRDYDQRQKISDKLIETIPNLYESIDFNIDPKPYINEAIEKIHKILENNGLFKVTVN